MDILNQADTLQEDVTNKIFRKIVAGRGIEITTGPDMMIISTAEYEINNMPNKCYE